MSLSRRPSLSPQKWIFSRYEYQHRETNVLNPTHTFSPAYAYAFTPHHPNPCSLIYLQHQTPITTILPTITSFFPPFPFPFLWMCISLNGVFGINEVLSFISKTCLFLINIFYMNITLNYMFMRYDHFLFI